MNQLTEKKILVIDDDPSILALIRARLEHQGFTCILTFSQPEPALQEIADAPPDLIILDIMLQGYNGLDLCRQITADHQHSIIPVIMITGSTLDSDGALRAAFDAGATDFVSKPIRAAELIPRVQAALRLKQTHDRMREEIERRILAEQAISAREQRFRAIAETTPDAVVLLDSDFKIIYWNKGAQKIYGYTESEVLGRDVTMLIPERYCARDKNSRGKYLAQGTSLAIGQTIETINLKSDGTEFYSEISTFEWREGDRAFFGAIIRDSSERISIEKKTREAKDFLENMFNTVEDGIVVTDKEGFILQINPAFADMLGYTKQEIIGRHTGTFNPSRYEPDTIPTHIQRVFLDGYIRNYETKRTRKDGTLIDVELNISILKDSEGNLKGMVASVRDITERKLAEQKREKLIGELREALSKVKTLSGLLPICASCKRIRDDQGYWNQIEAYIRDRSDAEFSHGICPECYRRLYPEFCDDETDIKKF